MALCFIVLRRPDATVVARLTHNVVDRKKSGGPLKRKVKGPLKWRTRVHALTHHHRV